VTQVWGAFGVDALKSAARVDTFLTNHFFGNKVFVNLCRVCLDKKRGWDKGKGFEDELGYAGFLTTFDLSRVKK
jgi:hypothetical protein